MISNVSCLEYVLGLMEQGPPLSTRLDRIDVLPQPDTET